MSISFVTSEDALGDTKQGGLRVPFAASFLDALAQFFWAEGSCGMSFLIARIALALRGTADGDGIGSPWRRLGYAALCR